MGSRESASHFRISTQALEFNLFARDEAELEKRKKLLEEHGHKILSTKTLDMPPVAIGKAEALSEGINLFNEERFWESHEVLEGIWRVSGGSEREALQSLILTAAAFVHFQKGEPDICLSVLKRAMARIPLGSTPIPMDFAKLRHNVDSILSSGRIQLFEL
ncbi:hypothetical protein AUH73_05615 [archaeon 13_1_40CM_4_53_4]|nr:MAG: hypothetical protein AUI07_07705 [archaeon 13_2_20CM_2_53_6]OLC62036.1 MAG: hypothetical protein AUH73_05615 [archaeon 13_1_40CM_4_53_4]OLE59465.1 MAG: hypothetical protein AUG17_02545 [Crenarchaeota archaeon 13_1_20CM_2_53_14]